MKIKLTPELAYIIGFWRKRRLHEGLGIHGEGAHLEVFAKEALERGLTAPDKLLSEEGKVHFYHTAYRKFFQDVEEQQLDRFKYLNDYSANYLAGMFDSSGSIDEKGIVSLGKANRSDEMMLLRLGFGTRWVADRLVIEKPRAFLAFVKNYVKIFAGHKAFGYLKGNSGAAKEGGKPII